MIEQSDRFGFSFMTPGARFSKVPVTFFRARKVIGTFEKRAPACFSYKLASKKLCQGK